MKVSVELHAEPGNFNTWRVRLIGLSFPLALEVGRRPGIGVLNSDGSGSGFRGGCWLYGEHGRLRAFAQEWLEEWENPLEAELLAAPLTELLYSMAHDASELRLLPDEQNAKILAAMRPGPIPLLP